MNTQTSTDPNTSPPDEQSAIPSEAPQGELPSMQEKFKAVKESIEACKSSAGNTVDVGEK